MRGFLNLMGGIHRNWDQTKTKVYERSNSQSPLGLKVLRAVVDCLILCVKVSVSAKPFLVWLLSSNALQRIYCGFFVFDET